MKSIYWSTAFLFLFLPAAAQQNVVTYANAAAKLPETKATIARLEKDIPAYLQQADVPGISIALIRQGQLVWTGAFGVSNATTKKPVTANTVFEAASLSKVVFAYAVLKLADEGRLNLDTPLTHYLGNTYDVKNDDRINRITARHVLSHTSGFPNWRSDDGTDSLKIHFMPGARFSYSGEGMVYLSEVLEKITGKKLEQIMQQYVFQPLGMTSGSYIWRNRYDTLKAYRHDVLGRLSGRNQPDDAKEDTLHDNGNAAASLSVTATDYGKFLVALLNGTGLSKQTWRQMFTPQIRVTDKYPALAWGVGIGLETLPEGIYGWHWGDNGDVKAWFTLSLTTKNAVVYFADGYNGLAFTREILNDAIEGKHPAVAHLSYDSLHSPARRFVKAVADNGAAAALKTYLEQRNINGQSIGEENMNSAGYVFLRMKRMEDAIALFEQNTRDYPQSWNVWDSLAEAYAAKGDNEQSVKCYEKSVQLNPGNTNGAAMIKKLSK